MLKLVLPKGSLEKATLELFEAADLPVDRSSSVAYKAEIDDPRIIAIKSEKLPVAECPNPLQRIGVDFAVRRGEIVDYLAGTGPATIKQVAEALGMRASALYHHFQLLEEAGLVLDAGTAQRVALALGHGAEEIRPGQDRLRPAARLDRLDRR